MLGWLLVAAIAAVGAVVLASWWVGCDNGAARRGGHRMRGGCPFEQLLAPWKSKPLEEMLAEEMDQKMGQGSCSCWTARSEAALREVLANSDDYERCTPVTDASLLGAIGADAKRQQRVLKMSLRPPVLGHVVQLLGGIALEDIDSLPASGITDCSAWSKRLVTRALSAAAFGGVGSLDEITKALDAVPDDSPVAFLSSCYPPLRGILPSSHRQREAEETLSHLSELVESTQQQLKDLAANVGGDASQVEEPSLLRLLCYYSQSDDEGLTSTEIADNLIAVATAGADPTARCISSLLYFLAMHHEWQETVHDEAEAVVGDALLPTMKQLPKLKVTSRAAKEAMRLHPPFLYTYPRVARTEQVVGQSHIAAGTVVECPIFVMHRNPKLWKDPEEFDPDRFLDEAATGKSSCAFVPFGHGPRTCLGQRLAMIVVKVVCCILLRKFRLELAHDVTFTSSNGVITSRKPLNFRLLPRE